MEIYNNEEQQVEAIKAWWKKNGNAAIGAVALSLALVYGFRFYQDYQKQEKEQASEAYEQLTEQGQFQSFLEQHADSGYAPLIELKQAKASVDAGDFSAAATALKKVADNGGYPDELVQLAKYRLARVQLQLQSYDDALATLTGDWSEGFLGGVSELKGDILTAKGDVNGARAAYAEAILTGSHTAQNTLKMKMGDLQETVAE